jgi:hypothetical protein
MAVVLDGPVLELIADPATVKVVATVDERGVPHAVAKGSLQVDGEGNLIHLELIERSRTNRNLVHSLWHDRPVSILLVGSNGRSVSLLGIPRRVVVSGPLFQQHYTALRARLGDVDLAGVWVIEPTQVIDQAWKARLASEEAAGTGLLHLDRIAGA